jgi:hypothetical protein
MLAAGKAFIGSSLNYRFKAVSQKQIAMIRDNGDINNLSFLLFDSRFRITLRDRYPAKK